MWIWIELLCRRGVYCFSGSDIVSTSALIHRCAYFSEQCFYSFYTLIVLLLSLLYYLFFSNRRKSTIRVFI